MSLSDFIFGKELGKGSFGSVQIVVRKEDQKTYAMKRVKITQLAMKERENALNEVRLLASLIHKNIIGYKEAFFDIPSETLNIVMEFADDGDIASKIKNNIKKRLVFEEDTIWNWLIQILQGLKYLHDSKIMHRDLKCANIFLTKEGLCKIGDLNVSKLAKLGMSKTQTGTPYYCAPEIWEGQPYDFKCDIWSVGCIIYELAMLYPPFRGRTFEELFKNIKKGVYEPISKRYSDNFRRIVSVMLITNPHKRPSCDELLNFDVIKQKMKEFKCLEKSIDEQGMQAMLMKTIKLPRNIKDINSNLPKKRYGKIKKKQNKEEMMMNDEYETQKTQFFKTFKLNNQSEENEKNNKLPEGHPAPVIKKDSDKQTKSKNSSDSTKSEEPKVSSKKEEHTSSSSHDSSKFEMKKVTIVPNKKVYRNDNNFANGYINPTPGGPESSIKKEQKHSSSENSTQSQSKGTLNLDNIPSIYNANKNHFLKYCNIKIKDPVNNKPIPTEEQELQNKMKEIEELKQNLHNLELKPKMNIVKPTSQIKPPSRPSSGINVHNLQRKQQQPVNLQNKYINEQFVLFRRNMKMASNNNNIQNNRKIVYEKMGYQKEGNKYKLIRLPSRGNNVILRPSSGAKNHIAMNDNHPIKMCPLSKNREMFVNNVNNDKDHFKIKRLYSNK